MFVFVSYARKDELIAIALVEDLQSAGLDVWWDARLAASEDFHDAIVDAISKATAAIVIWSKHSVASRFVRDEARFAIYHNKLISVRTPELEVMEIPFGFQGHHTVVVHERSMIMTALSRLGFKPLPTMTNREEAPVIQKLLEVIESSDSARDRRDAAIRLITEISSKRETPQYIPLKDRPGDTTELQRSALSAFIRGIFLIVPDFQRGQQGFWSAVGSIIGVILLSTTLFMADNFLQIAFGLLSHSDPWSAAVDLLALVPACLLTMIFTKRFILSRNWFPAATLSLFLYVLISIVSASVGTTISGVLGYEASSNRYFMTLGAVFIVMAAAVTVHLLHLTRQVK